MLEYQTPNARRQFGDNPDKMRLEAVEGWLGFGDNLSANDELKELSAGLRGHPGLSKVRQSRAATQRP
jgi:hypothetical protein